MERQKLIILLIRLYKIISLVFGYHHRYVLIITLAPCVVQTAESKAIILLIRLYKSFPSPLTTIINTYYII